MFTEHNHHWDVAPRTPEQKAVMTKCQRVEIRQAVIEFDHHTYDPELRRTIARNIVKALVQSTGIDQVLVEKELSESWDIMNAVGIEQFGDDLEQLAIDFML